MERRRNNYTNSNQVSTDDNGAFFIVQRSQGFLRRSKTVCFLVALGFLFIPSCQPAFSQPIILKASWYSLASLKKEGTFKISKGRMANNEYFDENALTCASWDFPLKTKLQVINVKNPSKMVNVTVTDRTHRRFKGKRIDLSKKAFGILAPLEQGLVSVKVERLP